MSKQNFKGLIQVYTGDGKGKTTAALGQGFRAVGRGFKVIMVQFLKGQDTGELISVEKLYPDFRIMRFDQSKKFFWTMSDEEKEELKGRIHEAFQFVHDTIRNYDCDILILDEIMGVIGNKLVSTEKIIKILKEKPETMEIILTGRNTPKEIMDIADLVTEMKMVKHPFQKGINARKGIEY